MTNLDHVIGSLLFNIQQCRMKQWQTNAQAADLYMAVHSTYIMY